MLCLSYYCLFLPFNGTGEKHRFYLEGRGRGERVGVGARGRNDPKNVCTYKYMNNKKNKERKSGVERGLLIIPNLSFL
jgi:hypothetical protein